MVLDLPDGLAIFACACAWRFLRSLRAMQADAGAADAHIHPVGALPHPMATVELDAIDPDRPFLLPGKVGITIYRIKQRFPQ